MREPAKALPWIMGMILLLAMAGCSSPVVTKITPDEAIDTQDLTGHWVRSYEEEADASEEQIFRPAHSRDFPPLWFRMAYVFHEDGVLEWMVLAPNDAHHLEPGSWELDAEAGPILHVEADGPRMFEVLELTEDVLRIREIPIR